jgi:magnesium transporter
MIARTFAEQFAVVHPGEAARAMDLFPAEEVAEALETMPASAAGCVLERLSRPTAAAALECLDVSRGVLYLTGLAPRAAASLLRSIGPDRRALLLDAMPRETGEGLSRLLSLPEGSVGAAVDPDVLTMHGDTEAGEALEAMRRRPGALHHVVHVLEDAGRLAGVVHVRDLMRAEPGVALSALASPPLDRLPAEVPLTSVEEHPAWSRVDALPVVDDAGVFVGILRHRHLRVSRAARGSGPLVDALVGLGELYWLGLSSLMPVLPPAPGEERDEATVEADDAR